MSNNETPCSPSQNQEEPYQFFIGIASVLDDIEERLVALETIKLRRMRPTLAALTDLAMRDLKEASQVLRQLSLFEGEHISKYKLSDHIRNGYLRSEFKNIQSHETLPDDLIAQSHRKDLVESTLYLIELGASALSASRLDLLEGVLQACMLLSVQLSRVENFATESYPESVQYYPTRPAWHQQIQLTINRLHTSVASTVQRDLEACHRMLDPPEWGSYLWRYKNRQYFHIPTKLFSQARH